MLCAYLQVGQLAVYVVALNYVVSWILLALLVAITDTELNPLVAAWVHAILIGFLGV